MSFRHADHMQNTAQLNLAASKLEKVNSINETLTKRIDSLETDKKMLERKLQSLEAENAQLHKELKAAFAIVSESKQKPKPCRNGITEKTEKTHSLRE